VSEHRRVLVVDDQQEIVELTASILRSDGLRVDTAYSGSAGLDLVFRERYDLVLLDINMPRMDGWETLRLIRADDDLQTLPVVMFSIKGEVRDKVHAMQMGATDYITKPFQVDDLVQRVRRVLDSAGGGGTTDDRVGAPG
jgi:DNA-binding response OmpR family regulator